MTLICIGNGKWPRRYYSVLFSFNRNMLWLETIFAIQRMRNKVVIQSKFILEKIK